MPSLPAPAVRAEVQRTATLRFTPSTPISPNHPGAADGMPYYDVDRPCHRRRRRRCSSGWRRSDAAARFFLVLLLVVTAVLGVGSWYLLAGRFMATPDFTNLTRERAIAMAAKNGLQIAWAEDFSETVPVGQVIRTDPASGDRVLRGGTVDRLPVEGSGALRRPVPRRTHGGRSHRCPQGGPPRGSASQGGVRRDRDHRPGGASASIEAGKMVKPGTEVDLDVSKGPAPIKIVSFVDKPFTEAQTYYEAAGLVVRRASDEFSSKVEAGNVISSDPRSGSLAKGETITFTVSKGPEMIVVPSVNGLTEDAAKETLEKAGFKVKVEKRFFGETAWGTDPAEGQPAPKGSRITLILV